MIQLVNHTIDHLYNHTNMEYLPVRIDYSSKTPLAEQITERLRALIRGGILRPGDPLPTVRQLAFQLGVNFNTVARAYRALDAEGMIITWQGRGTFVEEPPDQTKPVKGVSIEAFVDAVLQQAADLNLAEADIAEALINRSAARVGEEPSAKPKKARRRIAAPPRSPGERPGGVITLRRIRHAIYRRRRGTGPRRRIVSRGTSE